MKIGLVEIPKLRLQDVEGKDWNAMFEYPLGSKQILMPNLQAGGFETELVNMRKETSEQEYGQVNWRGKTLTKSIVGSQPSSLDPHACDAWAVTCNFLVQREIALMVVRHLAGAGKPVVVGGSDAIGEPQPYLQAGAAAVVTDKSGAANWPIFDYVLGKEPREPLSGVVLADGTSYPKKMHSLSPQDWPLPSLETVQECVLRDSAVYENMDRPLASMIFDMGCDRTCDFCQTPTYKLGYKRMNPQRVLEWVARLKEGGAGALTSDTDQFLGRVLFGEEGRQEVFDIVNGLRELEMPIAWSNGLELNKATRGHGRQREEEDYLPDEELVKTLWGWDGRVGCFEAYIPAERPMAGRQAYAKLLPWQHHCEMMRAIVRAGVPLIEYGIIVGLAEDSHDSLCYLEEAVFELYQDLKRINPSLTLYVVPYSICPFPGTPQRQNIEKAGLLRCTDPTIVGNAWTASADTRYLSYEEVSDWQARLLKTFNQLWRVPIQDELAAVS